MKNVFVIDAVRTPIGKYGGVLSSTRPDDLLAHVIRALISRNETIDVAAIEEVIAGAANQSGEDNRNVARMALLLAGLPASVAGCTVNRLCASGLQAIMDASRQIICGDAEIIIAGGVESMTRAPFVMGKSNEPWSRKSEVFDTTMGWRFINPALAALYYPYAMGETAENVAKQWNISREDQDTFALQSQEKYFAAKEAGKFDEEIAAVEVNNNGLVTWITNDEHPRKTSLEKLAALKPAFIKEGTVTAGNSSGINDGASALLLANEDAVKKYELQPLAKIVSMAVAGLDPADPITVNYKEKTGNWPTGKENPELLKMHPSHGHDMTIVNGISRIGYMTGGKSALWIDENIADECKTVAVNAWRAIEAVDAGRIDLKADRNGRLCFIEANPLAGLNPVHSDLPILARMYGIEYQKLMEMIMDSAIRRIKG